MANDKKQCPACGEDHEMPFSKDLIDIFKQIQTETDEAEKGSLMLELASQFVHDTPDTDDNVNESIHELVADLVESRLAYERRAMLLSRILMRSIPPYLRQMEPQPKKVVEKSRAN